mgnify:CR=1 FL=1
MLTSVVASTLLLVSGQADGVSLIAKHEQALREAKSLTVTFTVQHLPAAPEEVTITFSRPGLVRIETPSILRMTDGNKVWEYDKESNSYTEFDGGLEDAMDWLKSDDVYAWAAFFLKDQFAKVSNVKAGNPRMVLGNRVIPVEFTIDARSSKTCTLYIDQALGVARGSSIKAARSGDSSELIVLAKKISVGTDALSASAFKFVEPAGSKKVEVSARDMGKWYTDLNEALKVAKATNRLVFVDIGTEWCVFCKKMAREVFPTTEFQEQAKYFVFVHLDGDHQEDQVSQFGVTGYPTMVILNKDGKEIHRIVGYLPLGNLLNEMNKARSMGK